MPKIVYLDTLPAQIGIDILESQSLIEVVKITSNGSYQEAFEELSNAHAYQVSAARDEVPEIFQVDEEFLSKTPNLLLVSSGGAGFDTIDVEACTKRGILVVNQTGGNAEAVAEHAVGMMISLLKNLEPAWIPGFLITYIFSILYSSLGGEKTSIATAGPSRPCKQCSTPGGITYASPGLSNFLSSPIVISY